MAPVQPRFNSSRGTRIVWPPLPFDFPLPLPPAGLSPAGFSILGFLRGGSSSLPFTARGFGCSKVVTSVLFMQPSKCKSQGRPVGPDFKPALVFSAKSTHNFLSAASICWNVVRLYPAGTVSSRHARIFKPLVMVFVGRYICLFHGKPPTHQTVPQQNF